MNRREKLLASIIGPEMDKEKAKMLDTTIKSAEENKNLSLRTTCEQTKLFLDDEIEKIITK